MTGQHTSLCRRERQASVPQHSRPKTNDDAFAVNPVDASRSRTWCDFATEPGRGGVRRSVSEGTMGAIQRPPPLLPPLLRPPWLLPLQLPLLLPFPDVRSASAARTGVVRQAAVPPTWRRATLHVATPDRCRAAGRCAHCDLIYETPASFRLRVRSYFAARPAWVVAGAS